MMVHTFFCQFLLQRKMKSTLVILQFFQLNFSRQCNSLQFLEILSQFCIKASSEIEKKSDFEFYFSKEKVLRFFYLYYTYFIFEVIYQCCQKKVLKLHNVLARPCSESSKGLARLGQQPHIVVKQEGCYPNFFIIKVFEEVWRGPQSS